MKQLTILLLVLAVTTAAQIQSDKSKILEQRAKAFHVAISQNDKEAWKKFMTENFTQTLIDRPMRAQVDTSESESGAKSSSSAAEGKLSMFQQLHQDFGKGKIVSIKPEGDKVEMVISTQTGMTGKFRLESEAKSPWLIDKLGIEVEATN